MTLLIAALALESVTRTISVFGNGDGELGKKMADGTVYTRSVRGWAFNKWPLGSIVRVTSKKTGRSATAPIKDRIGTDGRIDSTLALWKELEGDRPYGLSKGATVELLSLPEKKWKRHHKHNHQRRTYVKSTRTSSSKVKKSKQ